MKKLSLDITHTKKKQLQVFLITVGDESDGKITSDLLIYHLIILKSKKSLVINK